MRGKPRTIVSEIRTHEATGQDAIERVAMQRRQARELQDSVLVEWQRGDATRGPLRRDVPLWWFWQWETPEPVLDRDLPDRHRAQEDVVRWIDEHLACRR